MRERPMRAVRLPKVPANTKPAADAAVSDAGSAARLHLPSNLGENLPRADVPTQSAGERKMTEPKLRGRPPGATGRAKKQITLRLDKDIVERFRATGKGWQSRLVSALGWAERTEALCAEAEAHGKLIEQHLASAFPSVEHPAKS